jgi:hypothetical protein
MKPVVCTFPVPSCVCPNQRVIVMLRIVRAQLGSIATGCCNILAQRQWSCLDVIEHAVRRRSRLLTIRVWAWIKVWYVLRCNAIMSVNHQVGIQTPCSIVQRVRWPVETPC